MNQEALYVIGDLSGFTPQVGRLVSMLNYVRHMTLTAVTDLGVKELDYVHDAQSNSIGALLLHIAAAEAGYQAATLLSRELTAQEKEEWNAALALGDLAKQEIRGRELEYYLDRLERVRATTLEELGRRDDDWLQKESTFRSGQRINNYFKWFHVLGHEINHKGQILFLRSRASRGR